MNRSISKTGRTATGLLNRVTSTIATGKQHNKSTVLKLENRLENSPSGMVVKCPCY